MPEKTEGMKNMYTLLFNVTKAGKRHRQKNICCQDSAASFRSGSKAVAAVSDGCSSSMLSHIGSELCVRVFVETFSSFSEEALRAFCSSKKSDTVIRDILSEAIDRAVKGTGTDHQALSATLLGCIAVGDHALIIHVGDGFAAGLRFGRISILSAPENRGSIDRTFFATSPGVCEHIRIRRVRGYRSLLLSTDGLSGMKLQKHMFVPDGLEDLICKNREKLRDDCGAVIIST